MALEKKLEIIDSRLDETFSFNYWKITAIKYSKASRRLNCELTLYKNKDVSSNYSARAKVVNFTFTLDPAESGGDLFALSYDNIKTDSVNPVDPSKSQCAALSGAIDV